MSFVRWEYAKEIVDYDFSYNFMKNYVKNLFNKSSPNMIWCLEHDHIYTAGISAKESDLLNANDVFVYKTNRGGQYTYHGPGQRIVYVMLNLVDFYSKPDVRLYIQDLARWIILTLNDFNIDAFFDKEKIGIWVLDNHQEKKIAALGIRFYKWISYHGLAINIDPDLSYYRGIVPCGIKNYGVTSAKIMGYNISYEDLDSVLYKRFIEIFKLNC